jgi:hypothetical protein
MTRIQEKSCERLEPPARRQDAIDLQPAVEIFLSTRQVLVHLLDTEPIVIQIVEAGARQGCIQAAQLGEIEGAPAKPRPPGIAYLRRYFRWEP